MPRLGVFRHAEGKRVEAGDRPRAHREHVAQDAADAGGRALIGLDVARMVVALHLEHHRLAVADVDDARVLARPLDHPGRFRRQAAQMDARRLVGTVLVPHRRQAPKLREARHPADQFQDALILVRLQPVAGDEFGSDLGRGHGALLGRSEGVEKAFYAAISSCPEICVQAMAARLCGPYAARSRCATSPANRPRPSVQPMMSSTWFSGCGIMPSTLPRSLITPAIECAAPLILAGSSTVPS